ncbi:MAG: hypothetical protein IPJ48_18310 [Propionivibrio sp.]|uniref:Acyltransferase 3 domain-containing protein n=1 Tax=Candidatus Propionivibrio dominans TaxID=2954373 RepID=A0A9D7FEG4_9RHOO|nr:hypothetical protein [Candidatus Propionivibrio dominans]
MNIAIDQPVGLSLTKPKRETVFTCLQDLEPTFRRFGGLAVSLVLLYHANIGFFRVGFSGWIFFFVISGYLITGLVKKGIEDGSFRFLISTFGGPSACCLPPTSPSS